MAADAALCALIKDLGRRMDLGDLTVDEEGVCALQIDDRFVVGLHCAGSDECLWLYSDLGVPAGGAELYPHLLRSNLFWHGTLGATLSLTHDEPPRVVIAQSIDWVHQDAASLANLLESFLDSVEAWAGVVAAGSGSVGTPGTGTPAIASMLDVRA